MEEGLIYDGGPVGEGSGTGKRPCWGERHRRELKLNNEAKKWSVSSTELIDSFLICVLLGFTLTDPPSPNCVGATYRWKVFKGEKNSEGGVRNTKTQPPRGRNFISTVRRQLCEVICRGSPLNLQCL